MDEEDLDILHRQLADMTPEERMEQARKALALMTAEERAKFLEDLQDERRRRSSKK